MLFPAGPPGTPGAWRLLAGRGMAWLAVRQADVVKERQKIQGPWNRPMRCPTCDKDLDLERHGDLVFNGEVWCDRCRSYDERLLRLLPFAELEAWCRRICEDLGRDAVYLERDPEYLPDPRKYWNGDTFLLAEASHRERSIMLHPPGHSLKTLCHELAHIFTGQDHSETWARTFARLTAWVMAHL